ncbi:hypothetical protein ASE85_04730 [Sphingobium sp. Leaf26]|uniref:DUF2924 domain-containing protein n=1 Tax=Sphingobium sp. Leaf26 TaxID=1735693 RepID=UPI0006F5CAD1|nr:DUF2924 domain-containing protein [Sphingobium sp. Leaf26]KQN04971.1 hypothetical protein ASE85_04730 [Sphingobium sp. Leaf26]
MNERIDTELAELETLSSRLLRDRWTAMALGPMPRISPAMLRLALAWEIQARALGGHSRATSQMLTQRMAAKTSTTLALPGMRLVREWNGVAHIVTVGEDKIIRWNQREWRSLSEVARAITGTRWSGPAFFGLKKRLAA